MFLITLLHITACIALIIIVLLQAGKGADIGASLGGAGSQTLFGTTGAATMLSKVTTGIAILFMLTSLFLAYSSGKSAKGSLMDSVKPVVEKTAPAAVPPATSPTSESATETTTADPVTAPAEKAAAETKK